MPIAARFYGTGIFSANRDLSPSATLRVSGFALKLKALEISERADPGYFVLVPR
jgi:hypothetical protein